MSAGITAGDVVAAAACAVALASVVAALVGARRP